MNRSTYRTHLIPTLCAVVAFGVCPAVGFLLNVYVTR